jgi:hypothetical protein
MSRRRRSPSRRADPLPLASIYPTLDLHGATAEEAWRRTECWLAEQRTTGARTVRVVTGKGLHSIGPPVLRGEVEALLRALRSTLVAGYAIEPGGGAFRIELRRTSAESAAAPSPPQPRRADLRAADPQLRRRAEEALWELGVQPTPELIEAEVRRLRQQDADRGR